MRNAAAALLVKDTAIPVGTFIGFADEKVVCAYALIIKIVVTMRAASELVHVKPFSCAS